MTVETLALFALTEFLLCLSPGPAVLLVVGLSMRHGFRSGVIASLGILTTNAVFFLLSALGVGAVILASATLFTILKWVGAAYLVYLGIGMIAPLARRLLRKNGDHVALDLETAERSAPQRVQGTARTFRQGVAVQASNPKNIAFFVAILPQFVTPGDDVALQLAVLGVVSVSLELPILIAYGAASAYLARLMHERVVEWIEGIGGGILIGLGAALARSPKD